MTTTDHNPTAEYVATHPYLVSYWDQYGRPVGYTSHTSDWDAENSATAHLGEMRGNGAIITRARFYELDPATNTYAYLNTDMEH